MTDFIGNENRCSFSNEHGIDFRAWKHRGDKFCLCFNGFKHGKNYCNLISDCIFSLSEAIKIAEIITVANY